MRAGPGVVADLPTSETRGKLRLVRVGTTVSEYRWDGSQFTLIGTAATTTTHITALVSRLSKGKTPLRSVRCFLRAARAAVVFSWSMSSFLLPLFHSAAEAE